MKPLNVLILALAGLAFAQEVPPMPSAALMPTSKVQLLDNNGKPCAGCKLWTYCAGSTQLQDTFTDSTAVTKNTNPVVLDQVGKADIWVNGNAYKLVLERPPFDVSTHHGPTVWTTDNVSDTTFYYLQHLKYVSDSQLLSFTPHFSQPVATFSTQTVRDALSSQGLLATYFAGVDPTCVSDSTAGLQAAINAAEAIQGVLTIPAGCYKTTASLNITSAIDLRGIQQTAFNQYSGTEIRGTGTYPIINGNTGGPGLLFRFNISNLRLNTDAVLGGGGVYSYKSEAAIKIHHLSEGHLESVMIADTFGGRGKFASGVYCDLCSNVHFDYVTPTSCDVGFNIDNGSQLFFSGGSPSNNGNHYKFGVVDYVHIENNWMEWAQDGILFTPSVNFGFGRATNVTIENSRILTGPTSPYTNPTCISVVDNGMAELINALNIKDSSCRIELTTGPVFRISMTSAGSSISGMLSNNTWIGPPTSASVISSTTANLHLVSNSQIYLHNNATAYTPFIETVGTTAEYFDTSFVGSFLQHKFYGGLSQEQLTGGSHAVTGSYPQYNLIGTPGGSLNTAGIAFYKEGVAAGATGFFGQVNSGNGGIVLSATAEADGDIFMLPATGRTLNFSEFQQSAGKLFADLTSHPGGAWVWCKDCTVGATKDTQCVGGGTGAFAFQSASGGWKCPF